MRSRYLITLFVMLLITFSITSLTNALTAYSIQTSVPLPQPVVCIHFSSSEVSEELAKELIDYAVELGAKYIRFDIWWEEIEPVPGQYNETVLEYYKEIIDYMRNKSIEPIVILGTGYPSWVVYLIRGYYIRQLKPIHVPVEINKVILVDNAINEKLSGLIKDAMIRSKNHFDPIVDLNLIEHLKNACPIYYYESAKGYLTRDEVVKIARVCPGLPLKISPMYSKDDRIPVTPLPQRYKTLNALIGRGTLQVSSTLEDYNNNMEIVLERAYLYAKKVAEYLWYRVAYYQLGNELNHFADLMPGEYDAAYIEALGRGIIDGDPGLYYNIVNVYADWIGWSEALRSWLDSSGSVIDIIAIDHYPGTWTWYDWSPLDSLIQMAQQYEKTPAIMETGFPSSGSGHTEEDQASYVDMAFNDIMQRAQSNYIAFLSWYMLWDEPGSSELVYSGWGVLREDFSRKPGWNSLKNWFINELNG